MKENPNAVKKPIWVNIIFFAVTTLGFLVGAPLYIYYFGISGAEIALFGFYMVATGMSITVGYHRHFSHANFKTNKFIQFILLFFGAAAFEQTAYTWSSQHRDHHRFVDTDLDPYSIKKGFWYAHMGWLMFWEHKVNYENVKDLGKNSLVMHQHKYYLFWAVGAGIVLPVLIGVMTGHALGAFIFSVCARITLVYHSTFFINSICHMFGKSTYDIYATAKDHWLIAFLTYGEGYHNFHHRFPSDYRNGVRWYQWDPSKWFIALMEKIGFASKVCRVSDFSILSARLAGEKRRVCDDIKSSGILLPQHGKALKAMQLQYDMIRKQLTQWELAAQEYKRLLTSQVSHTSEEVINVALHKLKETKAQFMLTYQNWRVLINRQPMELQTTLLNMSA